MTSSVCDGNYIDESVAAVYDHVAEQYRTFPHHCRHTAEARAADARHRRQLDAEERAVKALVEAAGRAGDEERAVLRSPENRGDEDDEAVRVARQQGWDDGRLIALRGLAKSRNVELELVVRAALRGELAAIVKLPPVAPAP